MGAACSRVALCCHLVASGEAASEGGGTGTHLSRVAARMYLPLGENLTNDTGGLSSSGKHNSAGVTKRLFFPLRQGGWRAASLPLKYNLREVDANTIAFAGYFRVGKFITLFNKVNFFCHSTYFFLLKKQNQMLFSKT